MEAENNSITNNELYRAAVLGGIVSALTDAIPFFTIVNCFCCLGIAAGGIVAVLYLRKIYPQKIFTMPEIIQIGLLTGLAGAFLAFAFHYVVFQIAGNWQVNWLLESLENMDDMPAMWYELYEELQKPEMQGFLGASILIRSLFLFPIFTTAGAFFTNQRLSRKEGDNMQ